MMNPIEPAILKEAKRQHAILSRGVEKIYPETGEHGPDGLFDKLVEALSEKRPLKIKLGADPTAPDIHLGHTVVLTLMRRFQDLGHKVQFLVGDFTALIGDPTGRNKTRPPLTPEQIDANAKTYCEQVYKVLDNAPEKLELLKNSTWLSKLSFSDVIKLCAKVTVAQIIQREDFANRLQNGIPISMHELLYPLMQGYDSVPMACDIELGGTDQTFNCLMGRQITQAEGIPPQIVMTLPLLEGLDGVEKMSKSKNNYIGVDDEPNEMFGKTMSIPDSIMTRWFELLTDVPLADIPEHPMEAKKMLGRILVTRFHDAAAAKTAQEDFETRFSKRALPNDLPEIDVNISQNGIRLIDLMVEVDFASSTSEARRLISQNAVKLDGESLTDEQEVISIQAPFVLQVGKRRMAKISLVQEGSAQ